MDPVIGRKNEIERVIQISAAAQRTIRFCSAKRALEKPPSSKASRRKLWRATCRKFF